MTLFQQVSNLKAAQMTGSNDEKTATMVYVTIGYSQRGTVSLLG